MARSQQLVWTIMAGLVGMACASQSQARGLDALQVNIETRFIVVDRTFLRDIGVDFAHLVEKSTFGDADRTVALAISGDFDVEFQKRFKGNSSARIWCDDGHILQTGRKSFKSQKGANKHRFQKRLLNVSLIDCPLPWQFQPMIDLKGGDITQFLAQTIRDGQIELILRVQLTPKAQ